MTQHHWCTYLLCTLSCNFGHLMNTACCYIYVNQTIQTHLLQKVNYSSKCRTVQKYLIYIHLYFDCCLIDGNCSWFIVNDCQCVYTCMCASCAATSKEQHCEHQQAATEQTELVATIPFSLWFCTLIPACNTQKTLWCCFLQPVQEIFQRGLNTKCINVQHQDKQTIRT